MRVKYDRDDKLDVIGLLLVLPVLIELMNLTGDIPLLLDIERLMYLTKPALTDKRE